MKPISAEDNYDFMDKDGVVLGTLSFVIILAIALSVSIFITPLSISDSNPTSYIAVVMLMVLLFAIFSMREGLTVRPSMKGIIYSVSVLAVFFLLTSILRASLSFAFASYRIDALLFPLIILSIAFALFGGYGALRLRWLIIYSVFASPLLLIPILSFNGAFTSMNASLVYGFLKLLDEPVLRNGLLIYASTQYTAITIASTCADIGVFIGMIMFLIPVAYLFDGRRANKALWLVSGVVLLFALNFVRMLIISLSWIYYGIGTAVSIFHIFAGEIIFYIVIIAMILIAYRYRLSLPRSMDMRRSRRTRGRDIADSHKVYRQIAAAAVIGLVFFVISTPYLSSYYVSVNSFYNGMVKPTNSSLYLGYLAALRVPDNYSVSSLGYERNGTIAFSIKNDTDNQTSYAIADSSTYPIPSGYITRGTGLVDSGRYILNDGIALGFGKTVSNGYEFDVNYISLPENISGGFSTVNIEFFGVAGSDGSICVYKSGMLDHIESELYNIVTGGIGNGGGLICSAYLSASSLR